MVNDENRNAGGGAVRPLSSAEYRRACELEDLWEAWLRRNQLRAARDEGDLRALRDAWMGGFAAGKADAGSSKKG